VLSLRSPDPAALDALLDDESERELTYRDTGARFGKFPPGFRHDAYVHPLGNGRDVFELACDGLRRWEAHRAAGVLLTPATPELRAGTTLLVQTRVGPVHVVGGCRIVHVVDEPGRFGFVYGTLPSHPEVGEEAFTVVDGDGGVRFEVMAVSRWREPLVRLASPLARAVQVRTTRRYLRGLADFVARGDRTVGS
jgi:uncharacterized protein (UPF0548 family)